MKRILLALIIIAACTTTATAADMPASEVNKVMDSIEDLKASGLILKLNAGLNEVFVDPFLWSQARYDQKELLAGILASYCSIKKNGSGRWVDIKDGYTGKKIAKYSEAWGFKVTQ